jgi:surface protein
MKPIIIAKDKYDLMDKVYTEIEKNGNDCDLNHIDVSHVTDFSEMFANSEFNGDISQWDVSGATDMSSMFANSKFNGDISNWDVSQVENMYMLFRDSKFNGNISDWMPYKLENRIYMFNGTECPIPYWAYYDENFEERNKIMNAYQLNNRLQTELNNNNISNKKIKI